MAGEYCASDKEKRLVESTSGHELMSFLDAFSGYNQILMHPDDQEKTAFITDRGISRIASGEFLGYIVTEQGIEANPRQINAFLSMSSPRTLREVHRLNGRIAALNRFISRSTNKCLPFYQVLKKGGEAFHLGKKFEEAFSQLKTYLSEPPVPTKPEFRKTLFLYVAVSKSAVSGVLVREERREQRPIFYVSKSFTGAESRYPLMEKLALAVVVSARKLRPYFQSQSIVVLTTQPLRTILHSPSQSGRLAKWSVELSEYDIEFRTRTCAKAQVLADFLIELPLAILVEDSVEGPWSLYVDGASSKTGAGIGVCLSSPIGEMIEQSFLAGLRLAVGIGVRNLRAFCDSQLVASQFSREYEAMDGRMEAYLAAARELALKFDDFEVTKIPRSENSAAYALASLASASDPTVTRVIPVEVIEYPSIRLEGSSVVTRAMRKWEAEEAARAPPSGVTSGTPTPIPETTPSLLEETNADAAARAPGADDWRTPILNYLEKGDLPADKWAARKLKIISARYCVYDQGLMRRSIDGPYLTCIVGKESATLMRAIHDRPNGNHSCGRTLAFKIKRQRYFWPTMLADCEEYRRTCEKCQKHAPTIHQPTELLSFVSAPYPFMSLRLFVQNGEYDLAEAMNKVILANLKKRLDSRKGCWPDELQGVL
ncbi:PREDICTED: uncharacterized protein LOC104738020 [Camelina sativa]|uniref:Uncharacterized protein LOC104738020 n=1 Tax=Camelina sativa TaxID=90675 RepID=A0ABM0VI77_CAMSA|nr:PREDICTED: uncharacterized protein LOC104738020 [Camelina sativa]